MVAERLKFVPTRKVGVLRREEGVGSVKVIGLKNSKGLENVMAACDGVKGGFGTEKSEVKGTWN